MPTGGGAEQVPRLDGDVLVDHRRSELLPTDVERQNTIMPQVGKDFQMIYVQGTKSWF